MKRVLNINNLIESFFLFLRQSFYTDSQYMNFFNQKIELCQEFTKISHTLSQK
jgi:hypothetical protein